VRNLLSPIEGGGYGLGPDVLSAYCDYAIQLQYPGDGDDTLGDQMFPDGNTGFARLMVKTLIPDAFAGPRTVDAVWQNRVNFARARSRGQSTRIRLNSTVVRVEHAGNPARAPHVVVTYVKGGRSTRSERAQSSWRAAAGRPSTSSTIFPPVIAKRTRSSIDRRA
jgi:spermidine dehydrogenase